MIIIPNWPAPPNIKAFSTTRQGGVSKPPYDTFNLGLCCGDDDASVCQNRRILKQTLSLPNEPYWLEQVHEKRVIDIHTSQTKTADGAYTRFPNEVCVIRTADCLPILLCNEAGTEIAALHGGWRSLAAGIIEESIQKFQSLPEKLLAWLGPAISADVFEIGEEVREIFLQNFPALKPDDPKNPIFRPGKNTKWFLDIYEMARQQLNHLGVQRIYGDDFCTYQDKERFFSYRRDGKRTGRMATLIYQI